MNSDSTQNLIKIVAVDKDKCINCHACISACPVKYCNDGSGDSVKINENMCIACGSCMTACTHDARYYIDDFAEFMENMQNHEPVIAIVSPAIAANFQDKYLRLNGWLKSIGIEAIFDVSFGAELTVKSYIDYIEKHQPKNVIAQPCPALVNYIEIYQPELLQYLIPVDSPMLHAMKMIREFYPQYKNHKIAVISPCNAKKREFVATGHGDYNIGYKSIDKYLKSHKIDLDFFPDTGFDNPPAERAVMFSSPGGLLKTAERWLPGIAQKTRKIEGKNHIYDYFKGLSKAIENGIAPMLIDCLNCDLGCNGGPLTIVNDKSIDEIEYWVERRNREVQQKYMLENEEDTKKSKETIEKIINKYWKPGLYERKYTNRWENNAIRYPNKKELKAIYAQMHKYSDDDIYNCTACGYGTCEHMAVAIFNNLNRVENCHFYLSEETNLKQKEIYKSKEYFEYIIESSLEGFLQVDTEGNIIRVNNALKMMFKKSDIVGRSIFEFLDNINEDIVKRNMRLRQHNQKSTYEIRFKTATNEYVDCIISGTPLYDEDECIGSFAMITDITKLKNAQKALEKSNEELEDRVKERTAELTEAYEEIKTTNELIEEKSKELEKLSIVASGTDNAVIIMTPETDIEWVNNAFERLYQYTMNEYITKHGANVLSKTTNKDIINAYNLCISEKKSVLYENTVICKNGEGKRVQTTLSPIVSDAGEITNLVAIDADITELKEAEEEILQQNEEIKAQTEALQESEQRLQDIIDFLPDPVLVIDNEKRVVTWNRALEELTGIEAKDIITKGNYEYAIPFYGKRRPILIDFAFENDPDITEKYNNIQKFGNILIAESEVPNLKGERRYLVGSAIPLRDYQGNINGAIEIIRDITEKRMADLKIKKANEKLQIQAAELEEQNEEVKAQTEALQESEQRLHDIIDFLPDAVLVIDDEKRVATWNRALEELTGVEAKDIIGKGNHEYAIPFYGKRRPILIDFAFENAPDITEKYNNIQKFGNILIAESEVPNLKGERRYLVGSAIPLRDYQGNINGAIEIIRDITEKRNAEKAIKEANDKLKLQAGELSEMVEEARATQEIIEDYNKELEKLSLVASKTDNAIAILDAQGNFEWVNEGFTRLYGFTLDEFVEYRSPNIVDTVTTDKAKNAIDQAIKDQRTISVEMPIKNRDNEEIWIQTTLTSILDNDGNTAKLVAIDADINKLKKAEAEILEQKEELATQRDEIEKQRDIAETHRKYLTDSIQYASRIQSAMLPPDTLLSTLFPQHFVLFYPKDIVSGDFYWTTQKAGKTIVVAADCTGHGVPGGFLSMLGFAFLNEIINKLPNDQCEPNDILRVLRKQVIASLHQTGDAGSSKDGMDIALCIIDKEKKEIAFSGANNPLYLIREKDKDAPLPVNRKVKHSENEKYELIHIPGDKMPIGIYFRTQEDFTTTKIPYRENDTIYIFSDGYVDQFGGKDGSKFLSKNLKKLLLDNQDVSMKKQKKTLETTLARWQGKHHAQVDDILVIGIRL